MSPLDLDLTRAQLLALSRPSVAYCETNAITFADTIAGCGGVFLTEIAPWGDRRFEPRAGGTLAAWVDVFDQDAETIIDAVTWPVDQPDEVVRLAGVAPALGMAAAINPATYALGKPLKLRRTPLAWLKAGCDGATLLDRTRGARWLLDLPASRIAVGSDAHARQLHHDRRALFEAQSFIVPRQRRTAREAA